MTYSSPNTTTYIITSKGPKTIKVRYACGDEIGEREITLSKTMRYVVYLIRSRNI